MILKVNLFLFSFLITSRLFCQPHISLHGSLIAAVICDDGILIAADSRASLTALKDNDPTPIPFVAIDSVRKIFQIGYFKIAIAGNLNVGKYFWSDLIDKFNKTNTKYKSLDSTFSKFQYFIHNDLKIHDSLLRGNFFILAGYENELPTIMKADSFNAVNNYKTNKVKRRLYSDDCLKNFLLLDDCHYKCEFVQNKLIQGFKNCSENLTKGIGGPLNIIKIGNDGLSTSKMSFSFIKYKSIIALEKDMLSNKIKVIYFFPESRKLLEDYLSRWIK